MVCLDMDHPEIVTETREELDAFATALAEIRDLARSDAAEVKAAPRTTPVRRLDDVKAAKDLDLTWQCKRRDVAAP